MKRRLIATAICALALAATATTAHAATNADLEEVTDFGDNPGKLQMYQYRPSDNPDRPLVIAMHGCTQDAATYHDHSGWQKDRKSVV